MSQHDRSDRNSRLALFRGNGRWFSRRLRQCVNHFSGTGIAKLFAGFFFDCTGIVLQRVDVMREVLVFLFELQDLLLKHAVLGSLLRIHHRPIRAEDDVVSNPDRNQTKRRAGSFAAPSVKRFGKTLESDCSFLQFIAGPNA